MNFWILVIVLGGNRGQEPEKETVDRQKYSLPQTARRRAKSNKHWTHFHFFHPTIPTARLNLKYPLQLTPTIDGKFDKFSPYTEK